MKFAIISPSEMDASCRGRSAAVEARGAKFFGKQRTSVDRIGAHTLEWRSVDSSTMITLVPILF